MVSQTFPPDDGVGGRRWAKFAKYLRRAGCEVEVIAADLQTPRTSPWTEDVAGVKVHRYRHRFPQALTRRPRGVMDKLAYRVALWKMRLRYEGSPYDRALRDQDTFLTLFHRRMAAFEPDVVVVSGAPFNLLYYVAAQREVYRGPVFVADLRDPWIGGHVYGYRNLSERRELSERQKEKAVVNAFDWVASPWRSVVDDLTARHAAEREKFWWLPHVWDAEEVSDSPGDGSTGIDLLYGGNLYEGFGDFLRSLSESARSEGRTVMIHTSPIEELSTMAHEGFRVEAPVPSGEFFARAGKANRLLFLIPESGRDGFPTKLLEYAATGRPIVAVGYAGRLSRLLEDRGLGRYWDLETAGERPGELFGELKNTPDREWVSRFEAKRVTREFLDRIDRT